MTRIAKVLIISFLIYLISIPTYNYINFHYLVPIYRLETNSVEPNAQKLIYNGVVYISDGLIIDRDEVSTGKLIGKTEEGMEVYQVKNDPTRIILYGFMSVPEIYKME